MSKHNEMFTLTLGITGAAQACREAVAELGWRVLELGETRMVFKQAPSGEFLGTAPARVEVELKADSSDKTTIEAKGSNFGFGPLQSGHVRGEVRNLRNRVELAAKRLAVGSAALQTDLSVELVKLAGLHGSGVLSDDEFLHAKARLLNC
jgi:hypothetical protein